METGFIKQNKNWIETARSLHKAQEYRKQYEALEKKLKEELLEMCEYKPSYGGGFKLEAIERKGTVDYSIIPELKGIDLDAYRKEATVAWKLSLAITEIMEEFNL